MTHQEMELKLKELEQRVKVLEQDQLAEEESKFDKKWAQGLKYGLKIIDKYKTESEE